MHMSIRRFSILMVVLSIFFKRSVFFFYGIELKSVLLHLHFIHEEEKQFAHDVAYTCAS